ncbi:threonine/serine ThrE exporter family protein [Epibacterium ulvae]|uniref:threonine/serine ThrE exporter family protein n=1 Tax=Epibacterium ulvae TaxID=1156985 RepID=UPI002490F5A7|nr:threonine/serine exporter family protein [Epibacterium ulvae]
MAPAALIRDIVHIGETLHQSGCAPYKIEKYVQHYAIIQGVNAVVQATPTSLTYHFPDEDNQMVIQRLSPASIDLSLLADTITRISHPTLPPVDRASAYPRWLILVANIILPPAFLSLIGASAQTVFLSPLLGLLVWLCQQMCQGDRAKLVEFLSALVAGLAVSFFSSQGYEVPLWGLAIAAVILFVPGLSIANALECLAFNDLISGVSLLAHSLFVLMKLFIGIYIGLSLGGIFWDSLPSAPNVNEVPGWLAYVALPALSFSIGLIFNARLRDIILAIPVTIIGMWGPLYLGFGAGWIVGTWVSATLITVYGTWLAKVLKLTGAIYIVQGIIILVPGSRVLMGATQSLFSESLMAMPGVGLSAFLMFAAIAAGQMTALSFYSQKNRNLIS